MQQSSETFHVSRSESNIVEDWCVVKGKTLLELSVSTSERESGPVIWATKILGGAVGHLVLCLPECFDC